MIGCVLAALGSRGHGCFSVDGYSVIANTY